jgi:hypothetical protein
VRGKEHVVVFLVNHVESVFWESRSLSISRMELAKHILVKPLAGETDWPIWKRKIRDLLDYHEGALDAIDGRLVTPEPLQVGAEDNVVKEHKIKSDFFS